MWADAAGMFVRVARSSYPFVLTYALLVTPIAAVRFKSRPDAHSCSIAFWTAAFVPLLLAVLSIAGFVKAASAPISGPEGNLYGMAILGLAGSIGIQCAVVGFVFALAAVAFLKGRSEQ